MKMKNLLKKLFSLSLAVATLSMAMGESVVATSLPYDSYNYDYREYIHYTPAAYVPDGSLGGEDILLDGESIGRFVSPQDICKDADGNVYVADTGNHRIVVLDSAMKKAIGIIDSFERDGKVETFNQPYGVCVSEAGQLYIADSQNRRVVVLNMDGSFVRTIQDPKSESLEEDYVFTPLKVTVDYANRVYVIAQNMFEGIMVFETTGEFSSFIGTIKVQISLWDKIWKRLATKEERSKQQLYIPTEFTGIDIDPDGFVYATNIDSTGIQGVRRLNPKGEDVIKKGFNENVGGDLQIEGSSDFSGPSQFTDVVYRGDGIYTCLDRRRGRLFSYDHEGNLLYIFGGLGSQEGTFSMPVAVEDLGDKLVVLDSARAEIMTFKMTEYGRLINEAVALRYGGDEALAVELWQRVLQLDENNELANTGIGKAYLTAGNYEAAMKYLELGMNREYYSIAFRRYRNQLLTENASFVLTAVMVLIIGYQIFKAVRKKKNTKKGGKLNG